MVLRHQTASGVCRMFLKFSWVFEEADAVKKIYLHKLKWCSRVLTQKKRYGHFFLKKNRDIKQMGYTIYSSNTAEHLRFSPFIQYVGFIE